MLLTTVIMLGANTDPLHDGLCELVSKKLVEYLC